jgi:hypothetical protein
VSAIFGRRRFSDRLHPPATNLTPPTLLSLLPRPPSGADASEELLLGHLRGPTYQIASYPHERPGSVINCSRWRSSKGNPHATNRALDTTARLRRRIVATSASARRGNRKKQTANRKVRPEAAASPLQLPEETSADTTKGPTKSRQAATKSRKKIRKAAAQATQERQPPCRAQVLGSAQQRRPGCCANGVSHAGSSDRQPLARIRISVRKHFFERGVGPIDIVVKMNETVLSLQSRCHKRLTPESGAQDSPAGWGFPSWPRRRAPGPNLERRAGPTQRDRRAFPDECSHG